MLSTSLAIFFFVFLNIPWLFVVFLGVLGFFLYVMRPVLIAWTMEMTPKELGGLYSGRAIHLPVGSCGCGARIGRMDRRYLGVDLYLLLSGCYGIIIEFFCHLCERA